ncbi:hypothetical protein Tco_1382259, partial [Tanacetum coccineum]
EIINGLLEIGIKFKEEVQSWLQNSVLDEEMKRRLKDNDRKNNEENEVCVVTDMEVLYNSLIEKKGRRCESKTSRSGARLVKYIEAVIRYADMEVAAGTAGSVGCGRAEDAAPCSTMTVPRWCEAEETARLSEELLAAVRGMHSALSSGEGMSEKRRREGRERMTGVLRQEISRQTVDRVT